jgi:hypothetical protein
LVYFAYDIEKQKIVANHYGNAYNEIESNGSTGRDLYGIQIFFGKISGRPSTSYEQAYSFNRHSDDHFIAALFNLELEAGAVVICFRLDSAIYRAYVRREKAIVLIESDLFASRTSVVCEEADNWQA